MSLSPTMIMTSSISGMKTSTIAETMSIVKLTMKGWTQGNIGSCVAT